MRNRRFVAVPIAALLVGVLAATPAQAAWDSYKRPVNWTALLVTAGAAVGGLLFAWHKLRPAPRVLAPDSVDFGRVELGATRLLPIRLRNAGKDRVEFRIELGSEAFVIAEDSVATALPPGAELSVGVLFTPTAAGPTNGELSVIVAKGRTATVRLLGIGEAGPQAAVGIGRVDTGGVR